MNPYTARNEYRSIRILIADDDPDTRSMYEELPTSAGCEVVDAIDGRDALVKALAQHPAFVVTETRLAMLDGYALCEVAARWCHAQYSDCGGHVGHPPVYVGARSDGGDVLWFCSRRSVAARLSM